MKNNVKKLLSFHLTKLNGTASGIADNYLSIFISRKNRFVAEKKK